MPWAGDTPGGQWPAQSTRHMLRTAKSSGWILNTREQHTGHRQHVIWGITENQTGVTEAVGLLHSAGKYLCDFNFTSKSVRSSRWKHSKTWCHPGKTAPTHPAGVPPCSTHRIIALHIQQYYVYVLRVHVAEKSFVYKVKKNCDNIIH